MSLFNMFKSQVSIDLDPHLGLVVALVYSIAADGEIAREEIGHLHSVLGPEGARHLETAVKYVRSTPPEKFLDDLAPLCDRQQRLCILLNVIDSVMADGFAAPEEQALVKQFQTKFGFDDATLEPYFSTLVVKNDRSILQKRGSTGPNMAK